MRHKKIPKNDLDKNYVELSENDVSDDTDEDDATEEALFRIGNQTVKKTNLMTKSKKIQKRSVFFHSFYK